MSPRNRQVLAKALELPPIERAELIEKLLCSFEFRGRKKIDALWANEVERRIDAFEMGNLKSVSAAKVFKKIDSGR